jgi:heme O synthase-like polyprenyltransferase
MNTLWLSSVGHFAAATGAAQCGSATSVQYCDTGLPNVTANSASLSQLTQIFFGVIAAVAVLMIVIAGLRFITAQGNPQETSKARSTIIYSIIGLVVALIAEAIVSLVVGKLP